MAKPDCVAQLVRYHISGHIWYRQGIMLISPDNNKAPSVAQGRTGK